jgi:hypothetical protein
MVWVPNWSSPSRDLGIFVDQPAEPVEASQMRIRLWRRRGKGLEWCCLVQCAVGAMVV